MKRYRQLFWLAAAFVLFMVGVNIPGLESPLHVGFILAGVVVGLFFYLWVFWEVVHTNELRSEERVFWIVAIICLPMIGNMLYIIIHKSAVSKQVPKPEI